MSAVERQMQMGRYLRHSCAALILVTLLALCPLTSLEASSTPTIYVKTLDGKALPNAIVKFFDATNQNQLVLQVTTGSNGRAQVNLQPNNKYYLQVEYPADFVVYEHPEYDLSSSPEIVVNVLGSWVLRVFDAAGIEPVPEAIVTIIHGEVNTLEYSSKTDSNGVAEFDFVPLGRSDFANYIVIVSYAGRTHEDVYECSPYRSIVDINLDLYQVTVKVFDVAGRPVEDVVVELREELDDTAISSGVSDSSGQVVFKLVPSGDYYVVAKLFDYEVYVSRDKVIRSGALDSVFPIEASVVRFNVTVYDYDGERVITGHGSEVVGEIIDPRSNKLVSMVTARDGRLRFGHVPLGTFKLNIYVAGINVFSQLLEISRDTGERKISGRLYDARIELDGSTLVNSSIVKFLRGLIRKNDLEVPVHFPQKYAELRDVPATTGYTLKLYWGDIEVGEYTFDVNQENERLRIEVRGNNLTLTTTNLYDEPLSSELEVYLMGQGLYFTTRTDHSGRTVVGEFLPVKYLVKAFRMGIECGSLEVDPATSQSYVIKLSVKNFLLIVYDRDFESGVEDVVIDLYSRGVRKVSGKTNSSGHALFENLPTASYSYKAYLYGLKVAEGSFEAAADKDVHEIVAPGILDLKLSVVDRDRRPLDGGKMIISVGGKEVTVDIDGNGSARVRNLPNSTIHIEALYYRGIKVAVEPKEVNLIRDEMLAVIVSNVYTLHGVVVLKDEKPMNFGEVYVYVNGEKISVLRLSKDGTFIERLPGGAVKVDVVYKGSKVASRTVDLASSTRLRLVADVHLLTGRFYDTSGQAIEGLKLRIKSDGYPAEELVTDERGTIEVYLPSGSYTVEMHYNNQTYKSSITIKDSMRMSIMLPREFFNPLLTVPASATNLAAAFFVIFRNMSIKRDEGIRRRDRRIPRI